jgi:YidC/Oxa1 family membrane protein insertase
MKVMNLEWRKIDVEPMDLWLRDRIGVSLDVDKLGDVGSVAGDLLRRKDDYEAAITDIMVENLYNLGGAAEVGGGYIIERVMERREPEEKTNDAE